MPDLSAYSVPGTAVTLGWVTVPDPLATTASTRVQLPEVNRSRKFEGAWWGDGGAYVVCSYARTSDGSVGVHDGQVWHLDPAAGTLTLRVHFPVNPDPASDLPDGPDNITVCPWGGLLLAEDGEGSSTCWRSAPTGSRPRSHATPATTASSPASASRTTGARCSPTSSARA